MGDFVLDRRAADSAAPGGRLKATGTEAPECSYFAMGKTEPRLFNEATKVSAKEGEVILKGPDAVDVRLTPEAAHETSNRLWDGAAKAKSQREKKRAR